MSEMRERVARALAHAAGGKMIGPGRCRAMQEFGWHGDGKHLELYAEAHWKDFENDAGFALSAMREPTEAMVDKPDIDCSDQSYVHSAQISEIWRVMIDEALK